MDVAPFDNMILVAIARSYAMLQVIINIYNIIYYILYIIYYILYIIYYILYFFILYMLYIYIYHLADCGGFGFISLLNAQNC